MQHIGLWQCLIRGGRRNSEATDDRNSVATPAGNGQGTTSADVELGSKHNRAEDLFSIEPIESLSHLTLELVSALNMALGVAYDIEPPHHQLYRYFERDPDTIFLRSNLFTLPGKQEQELAFMDQSIYYNLSHPEAMLNSFRDDEAKKAIRRCYDRGLRLHPRKTAEAFRLLIYHRSSVVFESLWEGVELLFVPPPELTRAKSSRKTTFVDPSPGNSPVLGAGPAKKVTPERRYLNDVEATHIVLLCLHALVAAIPGSVEAIGLAVSELRVAGRVALDTIVPEQNPNLINITSNAMRCIEAFQDELCLRLLSRLLRALAARIHFAEILNTPRYQARRLSAENAKSDLIDLLCAYLAECCHPKGWLHGPYGRNVAPLQPGDEELWDLGRPWDMPAKIVAWIQTVLLKEWDGKGEVSRVGIVGSALTVLKELCKSYRSLSRGHIHGLVYSYNEIVERCEDLGLQPKAFELPFLAHRLDPLDAPVEWQTLTPTSKTVHLLSYPFLFPPATLYTYFRSLNYSCMSRAFETSLMNLRLMLSFSILDPADPPERKLIHRLKTAVSTYLVLEIRRDNVLVDAFDQLWRRERRELLRPLKVRMGMDEGEEGIDHGGVQQEFFRIAISQALDPNYGK